MIKGQLVQVRYNKNEDGFTRWEYGVVKQIYDDRVYIRTKSYAIMYIVDTQEREKWKSRVSEIVFLLKEGRAAMAKKSILGCYKLDF